MLSTDPNVPGVQTLITLKTIDAHAGGQPLRLIVEGYPAPRGRTMSEKQEWARREADHVRRALMLEPRGHADMCGAVLTEPVSPGSHAGLLFMHGGGYVPMSGHGVMAVTTIVLERGLLLPGGDGATVVYDTPAGTVRARRGGHEAPAAGGACRFLNVPSFVLCGGLPLTLGPRVLRADVAFAGAFYAIVDSEAAGLGVNARQLPELRRAGVEIARAVEAARPISHPLDPALRGIDGTIFTAPAGEGADLRSVTVSASGAVDRSPGGTSTAAIMAVLSAMGLLGDAGPFVHESVIGTWFSGRVAGRTSVGDYEAIVPEIEGSAWITGEHAFLVDERDPLKDGFLL